MTDASLPPVLSLRDVELTLMAASGPVHLLDHVSLDVRPRARGAIVGPSWSGNSSAQAARARPRRGSTARRTDA